MNLPAWNLLKGSHITQLAVVTVTVEHEMSIELVPQTAGNIPAASGSDLPTSDSYHTPGSLQSQVAACLSDSLR